MKIKSDNFLTSLKNNNSYKIVLLHGPNYGLVNLLYNKTIDVCHSTVGKAILNTSITIVFGFSILVLPKFIPTIYFGMFTGLAMLLAMISVLTLLPSLILVFKPFGK